MLALDSYPVSAQSIESFPSDGFKDRMAFWTSIFTQYGESEYILHDQDDLELVYQVHKPEIDNRSNLSKSRQRNKKLRKDKLKLKNLLMDLASKSPTQLGPEHLRLAGILETAGYLVTSETVTRLSKNIRVQRGIREKFRAGLIRSGRYLKQMQAIFRRNDLPIELAFLPHVESSFNNNAYSHRNAAGIWQFIRTTGRLYLKINRSVDERLHPIRATEAAARLLKDNFRNLGNWPLAVTAYNHGANGMRRAKRIHGPDLRVIIRRYRSRIFGFASKNFYAEFLAAVEIAKNPEKHFGSIQFAAPSRLHDLRLQENCPVSHLTSIPGLDEEILKELNPHITSRVWRVTRILNSGLTLSVPSSKRGQVLTALKSASSKASSRIDRSDPGKYRIQPGDTLGKIARKFGTSVSSLRKNNGLRDSLIYPGEILSVTSKPIQTVNTYRVQIGDTLSAIARKFKVSPGQLQKANGIQDRNLIHPGQTLSIPR